MSAITAPMGHAHYREQLKLMRAETVTAWTVAAFSWLFEAPRAESVATERDVDAPAQQRYFGAFHC